MSNNHDVIAALSESAVNRLFQEAFEKEVLKHVEHIDYSSGAFRIFGNITFDIPRGSIQFIPSSDDFVRLDEIDLRTDINLTMRIRIPEIAIPRICVDIPCDGEVCIPKIVLVPSMDINIPLDLLPITSEISGDGMIVPELVSEIEDDQEVYKWLLKLQLNPLTTDIDLIDIADTIGDLFESAARGILNSIFGDLGDIIYAIIGEPIEWLIRTVLDIGDDISEFFFRFLSDTVGLHGIIADFLEDLVGKIVIAKFNQEQELFEDKYSETTPMTIQIADVDLDINIDHEMVLGVTIEP